MKEQDWRSVPCRSGGPQLRPPFVSLHGRPYQEEGSWLTSSSCSTCGIHHSIWSKPHSSWAAPGSDGPWQGCQSHPLLPKEAVLPGQCSFSLSFPGCQTHDAVWGLPLTTAPSPLTCLRHYPQQTSCTSNFILASASYRTWPTDTTGCFISQMT